MAENNKKFNVVSIVILAVLAVALIMGIVGLCIDWVNIGGEMGKLKDMLDSNDAIKKINDLAASMGSSEKMDMPFPGAEAAQAFGIIAIIAAALTAVSYVVSKFVNVKALKWVTLGLAVLLIVSAIVTLICGFVSINTEDFKAAKDAGEKVALAAGPWLLSVFGIVGGAAGVYGALKG